MALADSPVAVTLTSYVPGLVNVYVGASSELVLPSPKSQSAETMPGASRTLKLMVNGAVPDICCWEVVTGTSGVADVVVAVASEAAVVAVGARVSGPHALRMMVASASAASHVLVLVAVFK
jgi:hypothetical protein